MRFLWWFLSDALRWRACCTEITQVYMHHCLQVERLIFIHADNSRRSKAFSCICVWFSLSVHAIKPKRLELQSPNLSSRVLAKKLILVQKVKGRDHRVTKCKNILKWLAWASNQSLVTFAAVAGSHWLTQRMQGWWIGQSCHISKLSWVEIDHSIN